MTRLRRIGNAFACVLAALALAGGARAAGVGSEPPPATGPVIDRIPAGNAGSATTAELVTRDLSSTVMQVSPELSSTTPVAAPPFSSTVTGIPVFTATAQGAPVPARPAPAGFRTGAALSRTAAGAQVQAPVPYEELHRRASLVMLPTAYAAHYKGTTGENAEVFLLWYIGTLYDQRGLSIAPISTLFIGADLKWSFLSERGLRPAAAIGYLGGLEIPFTGGVIKVSGLAAQEKIKQAFVHNAYMVLSHGFGPVALTAGAMRGFKKAFPAIFPMLRNPNFTTRANPAPVELWMAFAGADLAAFGRHFKVEVMTLPEVEVDRPWLVNTYLGGILGFDFAYIRDRIGWELLGYYQLPFYRWPDQKRMEKERDRMAAARKRR